MAEVHHPSGLQATNRDDPEPSTTSGQHQQNSAQASTRRDNHTPSCLICQRRKVKCNRVYPCAACIKTGLQCEFKAEDDRQGNKKRKRATDNDLSSSARSETNIANQNQNRATSSPCDQPRQRTYAEPYALTRANLSVGVSGNSIYESAVSLGSELASHAGQSSPYTPAPPASNNRHFLFDTPQHDTFAPNQSVKPQPPAHHVVQLWQTYLTNVDPVLKVLHAPTLQQTVLGQIGRPSLPAGLQALTSAIYFVSTVSLQDDECQALLQVPKAQLLTTYRSATEEALARACFVTTTDVQVLQALILYLTALQSLGETATVWAMTGLAIRIAGMLGLTSDDNNTKLSPFETEMQRRLWWTLVLLDIRTAEIVGRTSQVLTHKHGTRLPANLDDNQLFPAMQRLPESRPAATETAYVLSQATIVSGRHDSVLSRSELEDHLQEEILRFCDVTVPLQALTLRSAQAEIAGSWLDRERRKGVLHEQYSDTSFNCSLDLVQAYIKTFEDPQLQRWKWHWQHRLPWQGFVDLVHYFRLHPHLDSETGNVYQAKKTVYTMIETVFPSMYLPPRKVMALELMRGMLATANETSKPDGLGSTDPARLTGEQARTASLAAVDPTEAGATETTARSMQNGTPFGHGSRPFAALLPGMNMSISARSQGDKENAGDDSGDKSAESSVAGYKVDWVEFERLAGELCAR